jgi:hypothetical protein
MMSTTNRGQIVSTLVLYGLSRNLLSGRRDAEGNHRPNLYIDAFERFLYDTDPCILAHKILIDTRVGVDRQYCCFCYVNYATKDGAAKGRQLFDNAILFQLLMRPAPMMLDASHMFTSLKTKCEYWAPMFSLWVGNIFHADSIMLETVFKSFGQLASMKTHGALPYKLVDGEQPSAIVNYVHYADARALLDACNASSVFFRWDTPAIARPRANVLFVMDMLRTGACLMTLRRARSIARGMQEGEPEFIEHLVAIMRACPELFHVDLASSTIALVSEHCDVSA